ncbi:hypothetical protein WA026_011468 [Henosepilachna vigintioctopunctata]|uniref:Odorant receptor n=1 Tax=Henosepilachna vigintioctopunctata TaxID=420089 RepID=A0AAW1TSX7_9CUCU
MEKVANRKIKIFRTAIKFLKYKINSSFPLDEVTISPILIYRFVAPIMITGTISFIGTVGFLFMATKNKITPEQVLSFAVIFQIVMQYLILYFIYLNGSRWIYFFQELSIYKYGKPLEADKLNEKFDRWASYIYYYTRLTTALQFIYSLITNSFCEGKNIRGDPRYICGSSMPLWYPMEIESKIIRAILVLAGNSIPFFHYPIFALNALIFFGCINFMVIRVQYLKVLLSKVFEDENTNHIENKLLMKALNDALGYSLVPYYVCLPLMLAMYAYQSLHVNDISMPIILTFWLAIVSLLCLAGQRLETESSALTNSIYELPFYEMAPHLRKDYQIFLARVKKPLNIGIISIVELNNDFYVTVLKGCYSYIMFLLQMMTKTNKKD